MHRLSCKLNGEAGAKILHLSVLGCRHLAGRDAGALLPVLCRAGVVERTGREAAGNFQPPAAAQPLRCAGHLLQ